MCCHRAYGLWGVTGMVHGCMRQVFKGFMEGRLQNRFGARIKEKLGPDLEEVR